MENTTSSFWKREFLDRPIRFFAGLILLSLLAILILDFATYQLSHPKGGSDYHSFQIIIIFYLVFVMSMVGLIFSAIPITRPGVVWILRRWVFFVVLLATLIALFYSVENWRGRRAWEQCKRELEAAGIDSNWEHYIPPAIPDDQNIFKAPKMQERFVGRLGLDHKFSVPSTNRNTSSVGTATNSVVTEAEARDYIAWSDQLAPDFDVVRTALKRPYARMDGDYSQPAVAPIPNFVAVREVARVLGERAHCFFVLHQPDQALEQLTFMHDLRHLLLAEPTGKPMTLVAAMINVAVAGLYVDVIGDGFRLHAWQEPQLEALQKQLGEVKLVPPVMEALRMEEEVFSSTTIERSSRTALFAMFGSGSQDPDPLSLDKRLRRECFFVGFAPKGWFYQNMAVRAKISLQYLDNFDPAHDSVAPSRQKDMARYMQSLFDRNSPYTFIASIFAANFSKATETMAKNQNKANLALVACALERYHSTHNQYPDSLAALAPQFIEKVPPDIINGGELKYRKTDNSFVLYSIGWNEQDDGGIQKMNKDGSVDWENGDWVWGYAPK